MGYSGLEAHLPQQARWRIRSATIGDTTSAHMGLSSRGGPSLSPPRRRPRQHRYQQEGQQQDQRQDLQQDQQVVRCMPACQRAWPTATSTAWAAGAAGRGMRWRRKASASSANRPRFANSPSPPAADIRAAGRLSPPSRSQSIASAFILLFSFFVFVFSLVLRLRAPPRLLPRGSGGPCGVV